MNIYNIIKRSLVKLYKNSKLYTIYTYNCIRFKKSSIVYNILILR